MPKQYLSSLLILAFVSLFPIQSFAAQPAAAVEAESEEGGQDADAFLASLNFRKGSITLKNSLATINQTDNFRYLNNADTQKFLTEGWGNPPGSGKNALGMLFPTDVHPLSPESWAVVITYDDSGYVSDDEASSINYDDLLKSMQEETAEESAARVKKGMESIRLVGWAKKPYYDATAKKMYWAKRLNFGGGERDVLNYEVRVLGRKGVLDLNVVASIEDLDKIDQKIPEILQMVQFNAGNTYAEYNSSTDKTAAYGLAGLVAGGAVAAKTGLFKGLLVFLLASKKLVAIGGIALLAGGWTLLKRFFTKRSRREKETPKLDSTKIDS